jgi:predicted nucleic acid-binding Zn ribbon protein
MEPLGPEIRRELGRFGPAAGMAEVVAVWAEAVGAAIAKNAWPARIGRDGTLHVSASSSAWAFELGLLEGTILQRLRSALGQDAPPRLRFTPGTMPELPSEPVEESGPRSELSIGPAERRAGVDLASGIVDDELRDLVARAAAASLARAASDRSV